MKNFKKLENTNPSLDRQTFIRKFTCHSIKSLESVHFGRIWVDLGLFSVVKIGQFNSGQITLWSQGDYHVSYPTRIWSWHIFSRHDQDIFCRARHETSRAWSITGILAISTDPTDLKKSSDDLKCHCSKIEKFLEIFWGNLVV